jgi:hypothetical protein
MIPFLEQEASSPLFQFIHTLCRLQLNSGFGNDVAKPLPLITVSPSWAYSGLW